MERATDDDSPDRPLSELIDDRSDIAELRPRIKERARELRAAGDDAHVEDLLALTRKNDTAYISDADMAKAEWAAEMYEYANDHFREQRDDGELDAADMDWTPDGDVMIAPRKLHYFLGGSGKTTRDGRPVENNTHCWGELREGLRWAQILGLVDADAIKDKRNPSPQGPAITIASDGSVEDASPARDRGPARVLDEVGPFEIDTGYRKPNVPTEIRRPELRHEDADDLISTVAEDLVDTAFQRVRYDALSQQAYYVEVWCEKSGIIPQSLSAEYGVTRRPAGGGEMSYQMCRQAIEIAAAREQGLVIILLTDYDPKGSDMPKSAARKLEVEAAFHDTEVQLHHAGVTRAQVQEYELRTTPANDPSGDAANPGRKAYEGHTETFEAYAGQDPVEVDAFAADYPGEFRQAIADYIEPYYDDALATRIEAATEDAKQEALRLVRRRLSEDEIAVEDAVADLQRAIDAYIDRMAPGFEAAEASLEALADEAREQREEHKLDQRRDELKDAIRMDFRDALADVEVDLPDPDADGREGPLLDTRRGFFEQVDWYKANDIREE
ncbi:hypothetical protein [Halosegnis longus]|uniref:hypothetical protein n=1 Tax=Halosegnis longus TaxID=2216012 RepID=UPI00129D6794|nr:hypothetical protein [Halosegnis longus]